MMGRDGMWCRLRERWKRDEIIHLEIVFRHKE